MALLASQLSRLSAGKTSLYRQDGWSWAQQQAEALRRRDLQSIDWDNVIEEIESVGRAERGRWISHCARVIERMLAIEHWKTATAGELRHYRKEIRAFRIEMAVAIDENPGLQGQYGEMLTLAWKAGRANAVERLAEYSASGAEDDRPHERAADARLPDDCPYLAEHVAAYDPKRDKQPRSDVWPPGVAVAFNSQLQTDYEIQQGPQNSRGWSR